MVLPSLVFEQEAWDRGLKIVVGVDEVGRGAVAGPVVAGAVVLPPGICLYDIQSPGLSPTLPKWLRDSKTLSLQQRQQAALTLKQVVESWAIGLVEAEEIDDIGIQAATFKAMALAINSLPEPADLLLVDGLPHPAVVAERQRAMPKADATIASVAAASILAKVYRDDLMMGLDSLHPGYGLAGHKGYGTAAHQQAIRQLGPTSIHRRSFLAKWLS